MHLERWVIDELLDGEVRVVRSVLREGADEAPRLLGVVEARHVTSADYRAAVRSVVVDLEAAPVDDWTPETEVFVDARRLESFLLRGARRSARIGLPAREHLREGDVYWVVQSGAMAGAMAELDQRDLGLEEGVGLVQAWKDAGAEVWDVTAASRQAVKRLVGRAQFAEPSRQSMTGQETSG
jgi:hypothetical protein